MNDAPLLDVSGEPPLTRVTPGATNPAGDLVGTLLGTNATDAEGDTIGIAITAATGKGTWQYQPDGAATWTDLGKVSGKLPRKLSALDRVRFVPATGFTGIAKLIYRAWDGVARQQGSGNGPSSRDDRSGRPSEHRACAGYVAESNSHVGA